MTLKKLLKKGEVYWVNLDPAIGTEVKKRRPGVIISNDLQNKLGHRAIDKKIPFFLTFQSIVHA